MSQESIQANDAVETQPSTTTEETPVPETVELVPDALETSVDTTENQAADEDDQPDESPSEVLEETVIE